MRSFGFALAAFVLAAVGLSSWRSAAQQRQSEAAQRTAQDILQTLTTTTTEPTLRDEARYFVLKRNRYLRHSDPARVGTRLDPESLRDKARYDAARKMKSAFKAGEAKTQVTTSTAPLDPSAR